MGISLFSVEPTNQNKTDLFCLFRVKGSLQAARLDLYVNGEILSPSEDKRLISQVPLRDRTVSIKF